MVIDNKENWIAVWAFMRTQTKRRVEYNFLLLWYCVGPLGEGRDLKAVKKWKLSQSVGGQWLTTN